MRGIIILLVGIALLLSVRAQGQTTGLSQGEIDALRVRISQCWQPPPGINASSSDYVVVRVLLKLGGSLATRPVLVESQSPQYGPALVESATQALLRCQPFTMLKPEHYEQWKDLELKFDPHELLGGTRGNPASTPADKAQLDDNTRNALQGGYVGYTPMTFDDFKLDGKKLSASNAKVLMRGVYQKFGELDTLLPTGMAAAIAREYGGNSGIPLLTDDATRDVRAFFLHCSENILAQLGCPLTVVGHADMCTMTNLLGASKSMPCLVVEDGWQ